MRLYRVVSREEAIDIRLCGRFRQGPNSFEGKWFAESFADAETWGQRLYPVGTTGLHVIEAEVADAVANRWFRLTKLDNVGPGRYADSSVLHLIVIVQEIPLPSTGGP